MSRKYKFRDDDKLYFVTFTVTNWIGLFIRNEYKDIVLASIRYCQQNKDLDVHAWCIMTSHIHLIVGTRGNPLSNIMRDLKPPNWRKYVPPTGASLREPQLAHSMTKTK